MKSKEVVVYGASGYTGKLIMKHLADRGIPFVAAGRSMSRLKEQCAQVPELKNADYSKVEVTHDEAALTELLTGKKVIYNVVGQFMQLGETVVKAALEANCHYLDTTGETDWMFFLRDEYGERFAEKSLLLAPASAYMWTAGMVAAELALETPGVDSLDILYFADSATSTASTKSFLRMCTKPQYYMLNNNLETWPHAQEYAVKVPDHHRLYNALPWSGGGETVWFEKDERVTNSSTLVGFKNEAMFGGILQVLKEFEEKYRSLSTEEQEAVTNKIGGAITPEEPARENPDVNRTVISCIGRGNAVGVNVVLRGNSPYLQTGALAAEACNRILSGQLLATGFQPIAKAIGARNIISAWADLGYHTWEIAPN